MAKFFVSLTANGETQTLTTTSLPQAAVIVKAFNAGVNVVQQGRVVNMDAARVRDQGMDQFHYLRANASWQVIKES